MQEYSQDPHRKDYHNDAPGSSNPANSHDEEHFRHSLNKT